MSLQLIKPGIDHVEFIVHDIEKQGRVYQRMGFEKVGSRQLSHRGIKSDLWQQGEVRIILSQPILPLAETLKSTEVSLDLGIQFLKEQAEGICVLAVAVDNADLAYKNAMARGARSALKPIQYESPLGTVVRAEIYTPGNVRYAFIERRVNGATGALTGALFDEGLETSRLKSSSCIKNGVF
jgi:4-hydroxyphenylpyruvate dioxygenase